MRVVVLMTGVAVSRRFLLIEASLVAAFTSR